MFEELQSQQCYFQNIMKSVVYQLNNSPNTLAISYLF